MSSKTLKIKMKMAQARTDKFQMLIEQLVAAGMDGLYLTEGQHQLRVYLKTDEGRDLILNRNGTWDIE